MTLRGGTRALHPTPGPAPALGPGPRRNGPVRPAGAETTPSGRVLIIEDDSRIAAALSRGLASEGYAVKIAGDGENGFFLAATEGCDVVLLDLNLPGRDGMQILRALRARGIGTPVLILTARDGLEDRVSGLDLGADDYLVKPFAMPEVLARIRALLRRGHGSDGTQLRVADLGLNLVGRRVERAGAAIELTTREFDLLEYLVRLSGHVASREMLARDVWRETARATSLDNVIDVHMTRLRRKVDREGLVPLIHTVRGVGFVVRPPE